MQVESAQVDLMFNDIYGKAPQQITDRLFNYIVRQTHFNRHTYIGTWSEFKHFYTQIAKREPQHKKYNDQMTSIGWEVLVKWWGLFSLICVFNIVSRFALNNEGCE